MSWNIETVGTKQQCTGVIDEAVRNGMPEDLANYLKCAIDKIDLPYEEEKRDPRCLIYVKSHGHRPMMSSGSSEIAEIKLIKLGPWNLK